MAIRRGSGDGRAVPRWFDVAWMLVVAFGAFAAVTSIVHHHWESATLGVLIAAIATMWGLVLGPRTFQALRDNGKPLTPRGP